MIIMGDKDSIKSQTKEKENWKVSERIAQELRKRSVSQKLREENVFRKVSSTVSVILSQKG